MRRRSTWIIAAVGLVAAGALRARAEEVIPPRPGLGPVADRLEAFIVPILKTQGIPGGSIALVEGTRVTWARGFGLARPSRNVAATAETVYRVGSISKLFTDLAVMQLVERGAVDLDAPVSHYLPDFQPNNPFGTPITLRQMMTHRSGLVREPPVGHYFDPTGPSIVDTVRSLNTTTLVYPPTTRTKYSNAAIAVVGRVVEATRGEPFARVVQRSLIEPLGLASTSFEVTPTIEKNSASGLMWTYDGRSFERANVPARHRTRGQPLLVSDRSRPVRRGAFRRRPRSERTDHQARDLAPMWTAPFPGGVGPRSFGLGFSLSTLDGHKRVGHGGAVYGFATELSALPEQKLGVVVALNKDGANTTARRIGDAALRMLLALQSGAALPSIETADPLPAGLARTLEGRYGDGDMAVDLVARGDRLFMTPARGGFRTELHTRAITW